MIRNPKNSLVYKRYVFLGGNRRISDSGDYLSMLELTALLPRRYFNFKTIERVQLARHIKKFDKFLETIKSGLSEEERGELIIKEGYEYRNYRLKRQIVYLTLYKLKEIVKGEKRGTGVYKILPIKFSGQRDVDEIGNLSLVYIGLDIDNPDVLPMVKETIRHAKYSFRSKKSSWKGYHIKLIPKVAKSEGFAPRIAEHLDARELFGDDQLRLKLDKLRIKNGMQFNTLFDKKKIVRGIEDG